MIKKTDPDTIHGWLEDNSGLSGGYAEKVVLPQEEKEIADFLREMSKNNMPVTVAGGGTGVSGARVPFGGVVLATDKLDEISHILPTKGDIPGSGVCARAVVQAGVTIQQLQDTVGRNNLIYPPDPTERNAFIGATVATNASGARSCRYGSTRNSVYRLKVILSNGEILNIRRGESFANAEGKFKIPLSGRKEIKFTIPTYKMPAVKTTAGYYASPRMDLIDLFIGQEGTLGVITEVEVTLIKKIENILGCFVFFPGEKQAWNFPLEFRKFSPLSLEYMDLNCLNLLRSKYPNIPDQARSAIFFEQEISSEKENQLLTKLEALLKKHKVPEEATWIAQTETARRKFQEFRHEIPSQINELVKQNKQPKLAPDIAVPEGHLIPMLEFYTQSLRKKQIPYFLFGHLGENHLHLNFLPRSEEELARANQLYLKFIRKGLSLGGTVSAEHGIGKIKRHYLEMMYGRKGIQEMVAVKKALDPRCILGRGNIFPESLLP